MPSELEYLRKIRQLEHDLNAARIQLQQAAVEVGTARANQQQAAKDTLISNHKALEGKQEFILPAGHFEMCVTRMLHQDAFKNALNPFNLIAIAAGGHVLAVGETFIINFQGKSYTLGRTF